MATMWEEPTRFEEPATGPDGPVRRRGRIPPALLDEHALTVVHRLQHFGHEAYLVGGCVRDLLSGLEPKDFDVATDAHPNRIKRLFRNARIIGRRFRLAHILFGPRPRGGDLHLPPRSGARGDRGARRPRRRRGRAGGAAPVVGPENVFGTAPEDARRRDFTINALFYDPVRDEILDWVGGLADLEARVVRSIGDPRVRIHEDPVRMIRAVHFAERMGFAIEPGLEATIRTEASALARASPARLYVELLKVLQRARARATLDRLHALGVLEAWLPELTPVLADDGAWPAAPGGTHEDARRGEPEEIPASHATWNLLGAADRWGMGAHGAEEALALAPLLGPWLVGAWREAGAPASHLAFADVVDGTLRPLALRMSMPRRTQGRLRDILWLWLEMRHAPRTDRRPPRLVHRPTFRLAMDFLRLDLSARDCPLDLLEAWAACAPRDDGERWRRDRDERHDHGDRGGRGDPGGGRRRGRRAGRRQDPRDLPGGARLAPDGTPAASSIPSEVDSWGPPPQAPLFPRDAGAPGEPDRPGTGNGPLEGRRPRRRRRRRGPGPAGSP